MEALLRSIYSKAREFIKRWYIEIFFNNTAFSLLLLVFILRFALAGLPYHLKYFDLRYPSFILLKIFMPE